MSMNLRSLRRSYVCSFKSRMRSSISQDIGKLWKSDSRFSEERDDRDFRLAREDEICTRSLSRRRPILLLPPCLLILFGRMLRGILDDVNGERTVLLPRHRERYGMQWILASSVLEVSNLCVHDRKFAISRTLSSLRIT